MGLLQFLDIFNGLGRIRERKLRRTFNVNYVPWWLCKENQLEMYQNGGMRENIVWGIFQKNCYEFLGRLK